MNSAIVEGRVVHRRHHPVAHDFTYRVALPLLDLDEVHDVCALHPLWSSTTPDAVWFRRRDFHGRPEQPLADAVRDLVEERTGVRPVGPVRMLAHLRTWGWLFNPITCYWCLDAAGTTVEAFVADVTSTPWHGRHAYVVAGSAGDHWFDKELHVSPFLSMDQRYRLSFSDPGEQVSVRIESHRDGQLLLDAGITGRRHPITRATLGRMIWRYPLLTARVSAGIYTQAALLAVKGAPIYRHPDRAVEPRRSRSRP